MQKKELYVVPVPVLDTYALTVCALLTALSVVLARLLTIIPSEVSRFSLEAVPILLAGLLFGPLPGAAVGFAADFIGCLFSPFGYNPIFCLPPILYGLWAGLVRRYVWRRPTLWRAALAVFPAAIWQAGNGLRHHPGGCVPNAGGHAARWHSRLLRLPVSAGRCGAVTGKGIKKRRLRRLFFYACQPSTFSTRKA